MKNFHFPIITISILLIIGLISCSSSERDSSDIYVYEEVIIEDYVMFEILPNELHKEISISDEYEHILTELFKQTLINIQQYENGPLIDTIEQISATELRLTSSQSTEPEEAILSYDPETCVASDGTDNLIIDFTDEICRFYTKFTFGIPHNPALTNNPEYLLNYDSSTSKNPRDELSILKDQFEYFTGDTVGVWMPVWRFRKI